MKIEEILKKLPLWQMSGEEFFLLSLHTANKETEAPPDSHMQVEETRQKYVYRLPNIAELFYSSLSNAQKIKKRVRIDNVVKKVERQTIIWALNSPLI